MGGTALLAKTGIESQRLSLNEFERVHTEVTNILDSLGIKWLSIPFVREKTDFGDIDIIVIDERSEIEKKYNNVSPLKKIHDNIWKFGISDHFYLNNNPVASILYEEKYQIDFIMSDKEYADYNQKYLSWNDLGNLVGRIVKRFNLTNGHDGLYYDHYNDSKSHKIKLLLSRDYNTILNILELDTKKFEFGFDTYNEMFDFVMSSPYFDPSIFIFENLNNRNRVRDAKRKIYNKFLEYIDFDQSPSKTYDPLIDYPWIELAIKDHQQIYEKNQAIRNVIPGKLVMEITGLQGRQLGFLISKIKEVYGEHLIGLDESKLKKYIRNMHITLKELIEEMK